MSNYSRSLGAALNDAKTIHAGRLEARKAIARRAWEGGNATLTEVAQAAGAEQATVRRWAKDGGWIGTPKSGRAGEW